MAPKGIKASKILQRKSKAKAMEWVAQEHSWGTKYIPVEVNHSKTQQASVRDTMEMEVDDHQAGLEETSLPSMDVDKTFWIEEPDAPEQRRVH
jgi:hypothetical protein